MRKFLYDWRGSICAKYKTGHIGGDFWAGTQLWVTDKETPTKTLCKCGQAGCYLIEVRYKRAE